MNKNTIRQLFLSLISFLIISQVPDVNGQPLDSLWMHIYGQNTIIENAYDIVQKSDSGYLVVGRKENIDPDYNPYVISIDKNGELIWEHYFTSTGTDVFFDIVATSDGNYLVGGSFNGLAWLVKMNENGDTLWSKTYGSDFGVIKSLQELPNNDIIITGNSVNLNYNFYLLKTNQNGDSIWSHKYIFDTPYGGPSFYGNSRCARQTLDGGYILATGGISGYGDPFSIIVKTDSDGDTLWKMIDIDDIPLHFTLLSDILVEEDTVYFLGSSNSLNIEVSIVIIKMNSDGEVYWIKGYNVQYSSSFRGYYGAFSSNNTIYIAGSPHNYEQMIYVFEIEKNGDIIWEKYYGEFGKTHTVSSTINSFCNNLVIVGYNYPVQDIFVFKLGDNPSQISILNNPNNFDLNIYPNPTKSSSTIEFSLSQKAHIRITIYNMSGEELGVLANKPLTKGKYTSQWNVSEIPNGIYFCKVELNNQVQVKKIVVSR